LYKNLYLYKYRHLLTIKILLLLILSHNFNLSHHWLHLVWQQLSPDIYYLHNYNFNGFIHEKLHNDNIIIPPEEKTLLRAFVT